MTIYYKNGFFDSDLSTIPEGAVEISDADHRQLVEAQATGQRISVDSEGYPFAEDPVEVGEEYYLSQCEKKAARLLAETDWAMLPDCNLVNREAFATYRATVRAIRVAPKLDVNWPLVPKPIWDKE